MYPRNFVKSVESPIYMVDVSRPGKYTILDGSRRGPMESRDILTNVRMSLE